MATKIKEIILTGPESSGKSTLSQALAEHYQTIWVSEYARFYLPQLGRPYQQEDIAHIAEGQAAWQRQALESSTANKYVFTDTDALVCKTWEEVKYGSCSPKIDMLWQAAQPILYLLCAPDLPWQYDPLRETPDPIVRWQIFDRQRRALVAAQKTFIMVSGSLNNRVATATAWLDLQEKTIRK
jgi:nicotinamide riboside kinase